MVSHFNPIKYVRRGRQTIPAQNSRIDNNRPTTHSKTQNFLFKWFKIKKLRFYHFLLVAIVIIILPVFKEWNTLLTGNRITGISVGEKLFDIGEGPYMRKNVQRTGILYIQDDMSHLVYAPDNLNIDPGKKIPLIINRKDPDYYLIATIPGFYLQFNRAVKLVIVLIIWGAIFSTLIQIQKGNLTAKP